MKSSEDQSKIFYLKTKLCFVIKATRLKGKEGKVVKNCDVIDEIPLFLGWRFRRVRLHHEQHGRRGEDRGEPDRQELALR